LRAGRNAAARPGERAETPLRDRASGQKRFLEAGARFRNDDGSFLRNGVGGHKGGAEGVFRQDIPD
jgi:hypothetical protein